MGRPKLGRLRPGLFSAVVLIATMATALLLASPAAATRLKQRRLGLHAVQRTTNAINR